MTPEELQNLLRGQVVSGITREPDDFESCDRSDDCLDAGFAGNFTIRFKSGLDVRLFAHCLDYMGDELGLGIQVEKEDES